MNQKACEWIKCLIVVWQIKENNNNDNLDLNLNIILK